MENTQELATPCELEKMCMNAIDRSQGQLVDLNIEHFPTIELIEFLAQGQRYALLFCRSYQYIGICICWYKFNCCFLLVIYVSWILFVYIFHGF